MGNVLGEAATSYAKSGVGIYIYSDIGATQANAGNLDEIDRAELFRIYYGPSKHTHICTGKIIYKSAHHIDYEVNTFEGCSGAIIFLRGLVTQPVDSGVTERYGARPRKIKNVGFRFTGKPPPIP